MITQVEQQIIEILRELKPFEEVVIVKDNQGRLDHYLVKRSQKIVIKPENNQQSSLTE